MLSSIINHFEFSIRSLEPHTPYYTSNEVKKEAVFQYVPDKEVYVCDLIGQSSHKVHKVPHYGGLNNLQLVYSVFVRFGKNTENTETN